ADLLEQLGPTRVVEVLRRDLLERPGQTVEHVVAQGSFAVRWQPAVDRDSHAQHRLHASDLPRQPDAAEDLAPLWQAPVAEVDGLEPGDVLDRRVEIGRRAVLPAQRVRYVVTLLPGPTLLAPPGPVLVAAAFGEREEGRIRHRGSLYRERLVRYMVAWALVVVGEAAGGRAHLELPARYLEPFRLARQVRPRRRAAARQPAQEQ